MKFVYLSHQTLNIFLIPIHYDCSQLPRSCLKLNTDFTLLEIYKGFVLIALFNFQDTIFRCPASALSNFIIISYSFRFVKYFFLKILENFLNILSSLLTSRFSATYLLYHTFFRLSSFFQKTFEILSSPEVCLSLYFPLSLASLRKLYYYNTSTAKCQLVF